MGWRDKIESAKSTKVSAPSPTGTTLERIKQKTAATSGRGADGSFLDMVGEAFTPEGMTQMGENLAYYGQKMGQGLTWPVNVAAEGIGAVVGMDNVQTPGKWLEQGREAITGEEWEPTPLVRGLGTTSEFVGGAAVPGMPAMKHAKQLEQAVRGGAGAPTQLLYSFVEKAATDPKAFMKMEGIIGGAGATGAGIMSALSNDPDTRPYVEMAGALLSSIGVAGLTSAVRGFRAKGATQRAAREMFGDATDSPFETPQAARGMELAEEVPGYRPTTAEVVQDPYISQSETAAAMQPERSKLMRQRELQRADSAGAVAETIRPKGATYAEDVQGLRELTAAENIRLRKNVEKAADAFGDADAPAIGQRLRTLLATEEDRLLAESRAVYEELANPKVKFEEFFQSIKDVKKGLTKAQGPEVPDYLDTMIKAYGKDRTAQIAKIAAKETEYVKWAAAKNRTDDTEYLFSEVFSGPKGNPRETFVQNLDELTDFRHVVQSQIRDLEVNRQAGPTKRILQQMLSATDEAMSELGKDGSNDAAIIKKANDLFKTYASDLGFRQGYASKVLAKSGGRPVIADDAVAKTLTASPSRMMDFLGSFGKNKGLRAQAVTELETYMGSQLKSVLGAENEASAKALSKWRARYKEQLKLLPNLDNKTKNLISAKRTLEAFEPPKSGGFAENAAIKAERLAADLLLNDDDPVRVMTKVFNSGSPAGVARRMWKRAGGHPDAQRGLQRALMDRLWKATGVAAPRTGQAPINFGKTATEMLNDPTFRKVAKAYGMEDTVKAWDDAAEVMARREAVDFPSPTGRRSPTAMNQAWHSKAARALYWLFGRSTAPMAGEYVGQAMGTVMQKLGADNVEKVLTRAMLDPKEGAKLFKRGKTFNDARDAQAFWRYAQKVLGMTVGDDE